MAKLTELNANTTGTAYYSWAPGLVSFTMGTIALAMLVVQLDTFETVAYPMHELGESMLIGNGQLIGAEDIVYEPKSGVVYTGCHDGWIKRVTLNDSVADSVVENWVHTGGRPLGLAIDQFGDVFVADAYKGLLKVSKDGQLEVLTNKAEGMKIGLSDGVVVAKNGMVYFTDATYKCSYRDAMNDLLEGRPHGRLLSYDPSTKQTKVIVRDLYFANGVELSPEEDFVIFCETFMMRCHRYYLQGDKKGSVDVFANNLPGLPDNVRYDGDGHYWIAQPWDYSAYFKYTQGYPFVRKFFAFTLKHLHKMPHLTKFGGVLVLDLKGKPVGGYYDKEWEMTSCGTKIGNYLYLGSVSKPYILRIDLLQNPLTVAAS
ncbi:Six-bladed beta-propeller, TolB-like protein [Artemisia annua]|uniref:Six-bladed beta-propeller, TolB-like protein n=1 Tax=Artemisia annua TaxID=35608 RepID=A0A2U1QBL8_ARTAN|nr:Six-bladed beta-propeller, TolB-like protein [Artemisia annua]